MKQENFVQRFGRIVVLTGVCVIVIGFIGGIFIDVASSDGIFKNLVVGSGYVIGGMLLWSVGKIMFILENIYSSIELSNDRFDRK